MAHKGTLSSAFNMSLGFIPVIISILLCELITQDTAIYIGTEYVTPPQFAKYKTIGLEKGFNIVESAPLVRSSYHAEKHIR